MENEDEGERRDQSLTWEVKRNIGPHRFFVGCGELADRPITCAMVCAVSSSALKFRSAVWGFSSLFLPFLPYTIS
jgi:hypothetical protein